MKRFFIIWLCWISFCNLYASEMCLTLVKAGRNACIYPGCEDDCFNARASLTEKTKSYVQTCYRNGYQIDRCIKTTGCLLCLLGIATEVNAHLFSAYPNNCFILNYAQLIYQSTPQEIAPGLRNTATFCCVLGCINMSDCVADRMHNVDSCLKKWAETPTKRAEDSRLVASTMEELGEDCDGKSEETI